MEGRIEKIWDNESKNGRRYLGISIDGQRYTLWEEKYFGRFNEGDLVEFEWKKSGKFRNITEIYPLNDEPFQEKKHTDIIRMSCLKSASELISGSEIDPGKKADLAVEFARKFENYVKGVPEEVKGSGTGKKPGKS